MLFVSITVAEARSYDAKTCKSFQVKLDLVEYLTEEDADREFEWREPGLYLKELFVTRAKMKVRDDSYATLTFRDNVTNDKSFKVKWHIEYDDGFRSVYADDLEKIIKNALYDYSEYSKTRELIMDWLQQELETQNHDGEVNLSFIPLSSSEDTIYGSESYSISPRKELIIGFQFSGCKIFAN